LDENDDEEEHPKFFAGKSENFIFLIQQYENYNLLNIIILLTQMIRLMEYVTIK
jgi:hypothetical protein